MTPTIPHFRTGQRVRVMDTTTGRDLGLANLEGVIASRIIAKRAPCQGVTIRVTKAYRVYFEAIDKTVAIDPCCMVAAR